MWYCDICFIVGMFRVVVFSGVLIGIYEVLEMRDKDFKFYYGKGSLYIRIKI